MQEYYDHITVHGNLRADNISGNLSEQARAPLDARIDEAMNALQAEILSCKASAEQTARELAKTVDELTGALAGVKSANETLAAEYNKAIQVINNLSERVAALEKNYDPTLIK